MRLHQADRRTLLRLMADECYQETKLGAAFPPRKQQRSSLFWQLAASYLEQPLTAVMLAGMSLGAGGGLEWRVGRLWLCVPARLPPCRLACLPCARFVGICVCANYLR